MNLISTDDCLKLLEIVQTSETQNEILLFSKFNEKLNERDIIKFIEDLKCIYDDESKYSCYLFYLIMQTTSSLPNTDDENQVNLISNAIVNCYKHSLKVYVKKDNDNLLTYHTTNQNENEYKKLSSSLRMFNKIISLKISNQVKNKIFESIKMDYMVAVLSVISMNRNESDTQYFQALLPLLPSQIGAETHFKILMMSGVFSRLSRGYYNLARKELITAIRSKGGFHLLCINFLTSDDNEPLWKKYDMISKFVDSTTKKIMDRLTMIIEIFDTLKINVLSNQKRIIGACVYVLVTMYSLKTEDSCELIENHSIGALDKLIIPSTLLYGVIIMEHDELRTFVDMLKFLFSNSTVITLPSRILHRHLIALFDLYAITPNNLPEREKLANVIIFVLNNCNSEDLQLAITKLRLKEDSNMLRINSRVCFKNNSFQIGEDMKSLRDDTEAFLSLINSSNNNPLIFQVFLCLLRILSDVQNSSDSLLTGYDLDEEELPEVLHKKFFRQLAIIEPLQEMIQWKSLHSQFNEKPREIFRALKEILEKSNGENEEIVIIFFSLFKELVCKLNSDEWRKEMIHEILKLKNKFKSKELKQQIDDIFSNLIETSSSIDPSKMIYDDAMKLLNSKEIYCKVYGSDTLIKLIKQRDQQIINNRHTILAVALTNMKETESYAYLNIIRLLVTLTLVMDTEVIDALIAEYQNKELNLDERLKFGEVIVKVTEDLGQISLKYKTQLVNCFLKGTTDTNNEFRTSSLSSLGTICKILSYQIHHFFYEMFSRLEMIIRTDDYLSSKRAATMILSQILAGIPNLMEFHEYLLPIYRLLKEILTNESDEQTKLHASVGLDYLNEKTKSFLNPQLNFEKEIKVLIDKNSHEISEIKYK